MSEEKKVLKELKEEELEKVSGGCASGECLPAGHGHHVGKYDAENYIGQKFYIVSDDFEDYYCWGTLLNSYEEDFIFGTERTHKIHVDGQSDRVTQYFIGKDVTFSGDDFTLYLMY